MLAVDFRFPAGRYHATPWGRHVNEAEVAWPPEPWRTVRALIATWHRKLDHEIYSRERLIGLLARLTEQAPGYRLPPAVHAHTRHYMPASEKGIRAVFFDGSMRRVGLVPDPNNKKKLKTDTDLVFDAFARFDPAAAVTIVWNVDLDAKAAAIADELFRVIGYLGRAESWVEAHRLSEFQNSCDCLALREGETALDSSTGELRGEIVTLLAPRSAQDYAHFREHVLNGLAARNLAKRERSRIITTLPEDWLDAISLDTNDLRAAGWDYPPAARKLAYLRPVDAIRPTARQRQRTVRLSARSNVTTFRYALYAKPLPRIEDTVRVGEWARLGALGRAKKILGADVIPPLLSGHGLPDDNHHGHAFYLPEDADGDGLIDHLLIHIPAGTGWDLGRVLRGLTFLKNADGARIQLLFEGVGTRAVMAGASPLLVESKEWISMTPYLHPWHLKLRKSLLGEMRAAEAGAQIQEQVKRECRERGLPEPNYVQRIEEISVHGRARRSIHFHRFRQKRRVIQPDRLGRFLRLIFDEPVAGPLAFGFGCHFGLGLFAPK